MKKPLTQETFIERSNHIHNNRYDYSKSVYEKLKLKVEIICVIHGSFHMAAGSHMSGQGCPACGLESRSNKRRKPATLFIERANKVHDNKYDYSKIEYKNCETKIEIICPNHGSFWQGPKIHLKGRGCVKCLYTCIKSLDNFVKLSRETHGDKYDYSESIFVNNKTKIKIFCLKHNKYFYQQPLNHIKGMGCFSCGIEISSAKRISGIDEWTEKSNVIHNYRYDYSKSQYVNCKTKIEIVCAIHGSFFMCPSSHLAGQGCPKCGFESRSDKKRKPISVFIEAASALHRYKYNYDHVIYKNNSIKVEIFCPNHGSFLQTPKDHLQNEAGCPICKGEETTKRQTMSFDDFIIKSRKMHGDLYDYDVESYTNAMTKTKIICHIHGEFWQIPNAHYFGAGCPKCCHNVSHMETKWLDSLSIPSNQRNIKLPNLGRLNIDGWKEDELGNICVYEFNGSFWHGDPRVFDLDSWNNVTKCFFRDLYNKTIKKAEKIKEAGYKLITMWEKDFEEL